MIARGLTTTLVGICLMMPGIVQVHAQQASEEPQYTPLFTDQMIHNAAPGQADRMRKTEAENRKLFDDRQKARRERKEAAQREALEAREAEEARQNAQRASPPHTRGKVFKWVDANGRVHFGDAPQGKDAQEVKVGGVARIQGTPPPPPGQGKNDPKDD